MMDIEEELRIQEIIEQEELERKQSSFMITKENFRNYYENFFPFKSFFKWLGNEREDIFERREISYTLENDTYIRFLCYKNHEEFKKDILKACPIKIDIGAIFNNFPKHHKTIAGAFFPVQKELIFDIDLTDYDIIRTCCSEAKICKKCWKFIIVAYEILNAILVDDFGFENIMWIFSGRRGVHCWISDERAKNLLNDGRSAIANFIKMKIATNTGLIYKPILWEPLHPSHVYFFLNSFFEFRSKFLESFLCSNLTKILKYRYPIKDLIKIFIFKIKINRRAIEIIEKYFDSFILEGQDILNYEKTHRLIKDIIKSIYNKNAPSEFESEIDCILKNPILKTSKEKWEKLKIHLKNLDISSNKKYNENHKYELCMKEIKLNFLYPRLDINVSKHLNHLLKAPFCVHPKTGLISVPLDKEEIYDFCLDNIPNIFSCIEDQKNKK